MKALPFRCGFCANFHSLKCPAESGKSIREEVYFQDENTEPFDEACFELDKESWKVLVILSSFLLIWLCRTLS